MQVRPQPGSCGVSSSCPLADRLQLPTNNTYPPSSQHSYVTPLVTNTKNRSRPRLKTHAKAKWTVQSKLNYTTFAAVRKIVWRR
jgi:hypothetical protein